MNLVDGLVESLGDRARTPGGLLALGYAQAIDDASSVPSPYADALRLLETAAELADAERIDGATVKAYHRVARALSVAALYSDLGPKLLAALDALQLTPRAQAAARGAVTGVAAPTQAEDDVTRARRRRAARGAAG